MNATPFSLEHKPVVGRVERHSAQVRAITCGNGSPMTFTGTRSYIYGQGQVALIDPGPLDQAHRAAIMAALEPGETISHILITHSHVDHSPLAAVMARELGVPIVAFGTSHAGRSAVMQELAQAFDLGGGEGVDSAFQPDILVADGAVITGPDWQLEVTHTPGHLSNHVCFSDAKVMFSGDHVMGWATSLVSPPDGDLTQFMDSLEKLRGRSEQVYFPGHGAPIEDPQRIVEHLIAHRRGREAQILALLETGAMSVQRLTASMYKDVAPALHPAAARNVFAHLIDLTTRNFAAPQGALSPDAVFERTG